MNARNTRGQTPLNAAYDRIDKVSGIHEIIQFLKRAASSENLSSAEFDDITPEASDDEESEDVLKFLGFSNAQVFEPLIKKAGLLDTPQRSNFPEMKKALVTKASDKPGSPKVSVRLNQLKGDVQKVEGAKARLTYGMEGKLGPNLRLAQVVSWEELHVVHHLPTFGSLSCFTFRSREGRFNVTELQSPEGGGRL